MTLPARIRIVEVGPRDGLQSEAQALSTGQRVELIDRLSACGLPVIESGSFVAPGRVPQMANSDEVLRAINRHPQTRYPVLVPNLRGMQDAVAAGVNDIAVFTAASETFSQRNTNCTIDESLARFTPVIALARQHGVRVRGYVSCALGCPYEGAVAAHAVAAIAARLYAAGCEEISLADTIGVGTAGQARAMLETVAGAIPMSALAVHFHDTYGQALANVLACLQAGVGVVDSAIAGLGGCPFAPGASGNLATEDLVYMLNGLGIDTGVDLDALLDTGAWISTCLDRKPASQVLLARSH